jgi:hypothetical protein
MKEFNYIQKVILLKKDPLKFIDALIKIIVD